MTKNRILAGLCAATALTLAPQAVAAQDSTDAAAAAEQPLTIEPQVRTRDMTGTFGGQRVSYRATIAETVVKADDGKVAGQQFIDSLKLVSHVANVGSAQSLAIHPASTTHSQLSAEQQAAAGVKPEMVRLSVGIETGDDILADLEQAFKSVA